MQHDLTDDQREALRRVRDAIGEEMPTLHGTGLLLVGLAAAHFAMNDVLDEMEVRS